MPEDNEKVDDFVSLWKKKMEDENKTSSAIGETLEKMKEVEEENEKLRNKIQENIELITRTEEVIRKTIDENESLKKQLEESGKIDEKRLNEIQQENITLNSKIINLETDLKEKEIDLRSKINEITELKKNLEIASEMQKTVEISPVEKDSEVTTALIDGLKSDLSKKKAQIEEQDKKINDLIEENEALNQQLIDKMKKLPIDYVVPVEIPKSSVIKPQTTKPSTETLELLCQDLQSDLNKYKRIVEQLNKEKTELEKTIVSSGFQLEPEELKNLKKENEDLKNELSQLQISLQTKSQEAVRANQVNEAEKKINILQEQLEEKEKLIAELKVSQESQPSVQEGPMSGLIEELQNRINKLKLELQEKNKIIEKLKLS